MLRLKCVFFFPNILAYMLACVDRSKRPRVNCCVQVESLYLISTRFFLYLSIDVAHNWPPQHRMPVQYTQLVVYVATIRHVKFRTYADSMCELYWSRKYALLIVAYCQNCANLRGVIDNAKWQRYLTKISAKYVSSSVI